jgi:spore coat polysaccharide biosynthesis protein SpsF
MKVLVIGGGSIGTRYARLLRQSFAPEILVLEPDDHRRTVFMQTVIARPVASLDIGLLEHPEAAIICSPTSMHASQCLQAVRAGCHVLLEKPLSHNLDDVNLLIEEVRSRKQVVLVSCNFRFDPALSQMKQWIESGLVGTPLTCRASYGQDLRKSRPERDYRTVYASSKALGGGIVLDSVHEIDYLSWFFGSVGSVSAMTCKLSDLEMDAEDSANLLLRFNSGVRALIQLDYFRPEYNRTCEVIGTEGIIQWSYSPKILRYFSRQSGLWSTRAMSDDVDSDFMYECQLRHFFDCIAGDVKPAQDVASAVQTLKVAVSALQSAESGRETGVVRIESVPPMVYRTEVQFEAYQKPTPGRIVAIIQVRMNSARLPGKALADICGKAMLTRVIERVRAAQSVDEVIVATSSTRVDDPIAALCDTLGIRCFRGSALDVLDRFYRAAEHANADTVVRITGDCPLIDPELIDELILTFRRTGMDYVSNRRYGSPQVSHSYPDGLDVEIFRIEVLRIAHLDAELDYDHEHVTPFIWRNCDRFSVLYTQSPTEFSHRQWTVDYPEDLEFVRIIYTRLEGDTFSLRTVLKLLEENPQIARMNHHLAARGDLRYAPRESPNGNAPRVPFG